MTSSTLKGLFLLALGTTAAFGGDLERFCVGTTTYTERWPSATAGAVPMTIVLVHDTVMGDSFLAPGFPGFACSGTSIQDAPGMQSLQRAAFSWSNISLGSPNSGLLSSFGFQPSSSWGSVTLTPAGGFAPGTVLPSQIGYVQGGPNQNIISFWEPASTFATIGGPAAISTASVMTSQMAYVAPIGTILDADVAFQAATTMSISAPASPTGPYGVSSILPFWTFTEHNTSLGAYVATDPNYQASLASTPQQVVPTRVSLPLSGVVDLQGAAAHELGHVAGLGHSLIDATSRPDGSLMPTMFPLAQTGQPFSERTIVVQPPTSLCRLPLSRDPLDAGITPLGLPVGESAASLELDDRLALARGYPTILHYTSLGQLTGQVTDALGNPVSFAHVVAIDKNNSDDNIVSTFAYGGTYDMYVPPGEWYLKAEPIDVAGYFKAFTPYGIPNYYAIPSLGGCVTPQPFVPEFWNSQDAVQESPSLADTVQVGNVFSGTPTAVAHFAVDLTSRPPLQACLGVGGAGCSTGTLSSHGVLVQKLAPVIGANTLFVQASGGPANAGLVCTLLIDKQWSMTPYSNGTGPSQIYRLGSSPTAVSAICDASGTARFNLPFVPGTQGYNYLLQAGFQSGLLSNTVNLWIAYR